MISKFINTICLALLVFICNLSVAQQPVSLVASTEFNLDNDTKFVMSGIVKVQLPGGASLKTALSEILIDAGTITISGDLFGPGTFNGTSFSTLVLNGNGRSTGSLKFAGSNFLNTLTLNRTGSAITLNSPLTITNAFNLQNGILNTSNTNLPTLGINGISIGTLSYSAGQINGPFQRWFAASGNLGVSGDFPIGNGITLYNARIEFTAAPTAAGTLMVQWISGAPGTAGLPLSDGALNLVNAATTGYWKIDAGNGLTGGNYTSSLSATSYGGVNNFSTLRTIKRPSGGGSWTLNGAAGTNTGSNALPVIVRTGMSGFSEFGIAGTTENPLGNASVTVVSSLSAFTTCAGTASAEQSFTVSGINLSNNIVVTAPAGFEVSTTSGSGYGTTVTLPQTGGNVPTTTIYVRITSTASGTPSGNVTCASSPAITQNVAVSGTVNNVTGGSITSGSIAVDQTICSGGDPITIYTSIASTGTALTYQWQSSTVNCSTGFLNIDGATQSYYNPPPGLTQTTYYQRVTTSTLNSVACSTNSNCVTVTVNPTPNAVATPTSQTNCSGVPITTIVLTGSVSGTTFNWTRNYTTAVTGIAASGSGDISGTLTNTTNAPVTVTFTITPTANGCPGTPITATVLVNPPPPTPTITAGGPLSFCAGGSVTLSSSAATGNQWYRNGSMIPGATGQDYIASTSGAYTVMVTLLGCSSEASAGISVSVNSIPVFTAPVSTTLSNVQYSDPIVPVTITVTDDGAGSALSATTTFKLGAGAFTPGLPSNLTLVVAGTGANSRSWTLSGIANVAPGIYTIRVAVTDGQCNSFIDLSLTVTCEDARAYYTGSCYASTSSPTSSNATVTLSATIKDISATPDAAGDVSPGDIRNATVTFINRDNNTIIAANVPVGLVNPGDLTVGTATYNWNTTITGDAQSFTIGIIVNNYYCRNHSDDNTVITVAKPLGDLFISGGGYLVLTSSAGIKAGTAGTKNNFGFNVKYNKAGTNLQGKINTIIRRMEAGVMRVYQIKGNSMTSLLVNANCPKTATFNGKANITDITNQSAPFAVDANASLQMKMTDIGEPGSSDKIAITVWNKNGGLWFASNWNGTTTVEQTLGGGNLKVHGGVPCVPVVTRTNDAITVIPNNDNADADLFNVKAYPNPSNSNYTIVVNASDKTESIKLQVMDVSGRIVEVRNNIIAGTAFRLGDQYMPGSYLVRVIQGKEQKEMKLIKLPE